MKLQLRTLWILSLCLFAQASTAQNCLDFDGTDDKVDCGNDTSIQIQGATITLEAWIYPTAWKTNAYDGNVICKEENGKSNYGYMLRVGDGGKLNFAIGDGGWREITTTALLSLNTWQHIAGTYDGNKMRVYINGVVVDSASLSTSIGNATITPLLLGAHTSYTRNYQGRIDEVRVWNICRTGAQINKEMGNELCTRMKGLRAYYKFSQGKAGATNTSVKTLTDLSGFNNTGTLSGFALTGSSSNWLRGASLTKGVFNATITTARCDYFISPSNKFKWITSGTYYDTIPTAMACDSAITVNLTIKKSTTKTLKVYACTSYTSPSGTYTWTKSGTYVDYLRNAVNCDSVITIILKVGGSYDTIAPAECKSYTVPSGKNTYTQSGWYTDTLVNFRGCDSVIAIDLNILPPTYATINPKVCESYTTPSGKYTYSKKGIYSDTLVNFNGCDSVLTIKLDIMKSSSNISRSNCEQWTSPSGKYNWTSSGIYTDTINNYFGCDSFITVNLTINHATNTDVQASSCFSYLSPSKKHRWFNSGVYKDTLKSFRGCDSVITTDLTVNTVNIGVTKVNNVLTAASTSGSFQWLNCQLNHSKITGETNQVFTASGTGTYSVEVSENSCKDTSNCYSVSVTSAEDISAKNNFSIYPNPNSGNFHLVLPRNCHNATVRIIDLSGRLVYEKQYENIEQGDIQLQQKQGVYLVEIVSAEFHGRQRLSLE